MYSMEMDTVEFVILPMRFNIHSDSRKEGLWDDDLVGSQFANGWTVVPSTHLIVTCVVRSLNYRAPGELFGYAFGFATVLSP